MIDFLWGVRIFLNGDKLSETCEKKNPHVINFNENAINMLAMRGVEKFILINLNLKL